MVAFNQLFDARNFDPTQGIPQMPVGRHPVVIESSDIKQNSKQDGGYVEFVLNIIDGPAKGHKGAYRLNLYHSNQQTVDIAYRQLSALCHVLGVYQVQDTSQLHNIPFIVDVGLQKGEDAAKKGYTQVERVYDRNGNEPGKQGQQPPPAQPAQAPQQPAQQPAQQQPPAGGAWGGQPQQPAQAPAQQPGAWGGQPAAQAPQGQPNAQPPAWGGQPAQGQQPAQAPAAGQQPAWAGGNGSGATQPWKP